LEVGDEVAEGVQLAEVGKISGENIYAHLHFELESADIHSVNLAKVFATLSIPTKANDFSGRSETFVKWDQNIGHWTATESDSLKLAFVQDSNEYTSGKSNVWVAWHSDPSKRFIVRWDENLNQSGGWYRWNPITNNWFFDTTNGNHRVQWINGDWLQI
jgi:hypothetical protein